MKSFMTYSLLATAACAAPLSASVKTHTHSSREVPQEHSHNAIIATVNDSLKVNNPDEIQDAIFGLLGNAAGSKGQGKITDTDCLQQATADQAFTNAKAAGDVAGMTAALIYRALERNTGSVGLDSVLCTSVKAVNPEIAALQQHQDPAADGAAATNKGIALELAKQIASIGGDPNDAIKSGTFAPGQKGDPTGAGNTCDVADDTVGCIVSQNLLVADVTEDEIAQAVAGVSAANSSADSSADAAAVDCNQAAASNSSVDASAAASNASSADAAAASSAGAASASAASSAGALDFGKCSNPAIEFAVGLDGRKEASFQAVNQADFNHGSALNIKVISGFIQSQLAAKCAAPQATLDAAAKAAAAADAAGGKDQAAADAFNSALGVSA